MMCKWRLIQIQHAGSGQDEQVGCYRRGNQKSFRRDRPTRTADDGRTKRRTPESRRTPLNLNNKKFICTAKIRNRRRHLRSPRLGSWHQVRQLRNENAMPAGCGRPDTPPSAGSEWNMQLTPSPSLGGRRKFVTSFPLAMKRGLKSLHYISPSS